MDYNPSSQDINAVVISGAGAGPAGTIVPFQLAGQTGTVPGCVLLAGTYAFVIGGPAGDSQTPAQTVLVSAHLAWVLAVAATITIETCNFPGKLGKFGTGGVDVSDFDSTAGNWIQENPSTAYIAVAGSGNTVSNATVTAGGTAAGGCTIHLGNLGTRRCRIKVVTTVGGIVRCNVLGKLGA